jgi:hypothetical protein
MSQLEEVKAKITATEAKIDIAEQRNDVEGLKFHRELLLELQRKENLLLASTTAPAGKFTFQYHSKYSNKI